MDTCNSFFFGGGGGGGTPFYLILKLYRYVPPHQVGFLRRFGLKSGIFVVESGMVFEGTPRVHERNIFIVSIPK